MANNGNIGLWVNVQIRWKESDFQRLLSFGDDNRMMRRHAVQRHRYAARRSKRINRYFNSIQFNPATSFAFQFSRLLFEFNNQFEQLASITFSISQIGRIVWKNEFFANVTLFSARKLLANV